MGWQRHTSPPARRQKHCRRMAAEEGGLRPAPPVGRPRPFLRWRRPLPPPMPLSAVGGAGRKEVATSGDEVTPRGFWSAPSMPTTSFPSRRSPSFPPSPLVAGPNVPPPVAVHLSTGPRPRHCLVEPQSMPRERWGGGAWLRSIHSDDGGAGGGTVERADEHRLQATITPRLGTGDHSHVASSPAQRILSGFTTTATTEQNSASTTTTIDLSSNESRCRLLNRLVYRIKQRGFLENDLVLGTWVEQRPPTARYRFSRLCSSSMSRMCLDMLGPEAGRPRAFSFSCIIIALLCFVLVMDKKEGFWYTKKIAKEKEGKGSLHFCD